MFSPRGGWRGVHSVRGAQALETVSASWGRPTMNLSLERAPACCQEVTKFRPGERAWRSGGKLSKFTLFNRMREVQRWMMVWVRGEYYISRFRKWSRIQGRAGVRVWGGGWQVLPRARSQRCEPRLSVKVQFREKEILKIHNGIQQQKRWKVKL